MNGFIWRNKLTVEQLNEMSKNTFQQYLNINFVEVGDDYLKANMPVDWRTHQPRGIMHGGASVALAETTGSMAALMCSDRDVGWVGLEINANHISAVSAGFVFCIARPAHIGRRTQVWEMTVVNSEGTLVCKSRLTMLAVQPKV